MTPIFAILFHTESKELHTMFLSEIILSELHDEKHRLDALKAAELSIRYKPKK